VNLYLFGGLANELTVVLQNGAVGIGWMPGSEEQEGRKKSCSYYNRAQMLEAKYGKTIWGLSESEKQIALESVKVATNQYIRNAIFE
jgi:hypothetical protein